MNFFQKIPVFFFSLMYPMKVYGKENVPDAGAVLVCNHFRAIDCGFIVRICDKDIKFLAKKEIFKNKLVGKLAKSYGAIPIDRENPEMKSLLEAIKVIKKGNKLCIFPEGKRNLSGTSDLQDIKGGTIVFSIKAKCPIVPIMMLKKAKIFRKTHIIIGKPFELSDYYGKKLTEDDMTALAEIVRSKMIEQQDSLKNSLIKGKKNKC